MLKEENVASTKSSYGRRPIHLRWVILTVWLLNKISEPYYIKTISRSYKNDYESLVNDSRSLTVLTNSTK